MNKKISVSFRLDRALIAALKKEARRTNRSQAGMISEILEKYLKDKDV